VGMGILLVPNDTEFANTERLSLENIKQDLTILGMWVNQNMAWLF
jgi:hypothetical protein